MSEAFEEQLNNLTEIRQVRNHAEFLRDQLVAELQLLEEESSLPEEMKLNHKFQQGREAMRKAVFAANCAINSIDQALRDLERASDD